MNVGDIEYIVSVETQQSIDAAQKFTRDMDKVESSSRKADASLGKFNGRTKKMTDAVRRANGELSNQSKALSGLTKMVGAYLSIRALRSAIDLADRYEEMAGRIRDATESTEEYNKVQDRLLAVANRSYRALGEIQEAYIQSSRGLRDMGYSTEEALDITESLSLAFVRNSTSSDKAASAMNALVRATNRGTVLTDHWASLLIAVPTIVDDIAAATGKTSQEISKLGYAGELSAGMLTEGLRVAREENGRVADEMATTVSDAVTRLTNSFQVLTAQVNESSGASSGLSGAIDELASILQDPKTVEAATQLATGIAAAFGGIIKGAREVVSITRWMAEEVAATFNGIAADDVVRLEQEADKIRKALEGGIMGLGDRLRFFGPDGVVKFWSRSELEAELARIEKATQESYKRMGRNMPDPIPPPSAEKPQVRSDLINDETDATEKLTGAKRRLTDAEKELLKAERERDRGIEKNAETIAALEEQMRQAEMSAGELVQRQAELSLNEYATDQQIARIKELGAALRENAEAEEREQMRKAAVAADPRTDATDRYANQLAALEEYKQAELITEQQYLELRNAAATEYEQRRLAAQEEIFRAQSEGNEFLMNSIDALGAASANVLSGMAEGALTGRDAVKMLSRAILDEAVSALVKMGLQQVKTMILGKAAQQTIATTSTATGAAVTAAWTPAAAAVSLATAGANSAPAIAGIAAAGSAAQALSAIGGRRHGGPVAAGSMYRVNEGGKPEVFQNNLGQQYMIPNERGKVISNKDAQKGSGGVIVNIHNAPPGTQAEQSQGPDGEQMIDVWVADFMADGRTSSAVQNKFGLSPQGR